MWLYWDIVNVKVNFKQLDDAAEEIQYLAKLGQTNRCLFKTMQIYPAQNEKKIEAKEVWNHLASKQGYDFWDELRETYKYIFYSFPN